jgi:hypothetical protein
MVRLPQKGGVMRKGICIATAAWFVTVAATALGNGQGEKEPAKALIEMGADVRHGLHGFFRLQNTTAKR